jgi:hypothetical protein
LPLHRIDFHESSDRPRPVVREAIQGIVSMLLWFRDRVSY